MAYKEAEKANTKLYGLVYSRGTTSRFRPNKIAKDDDLIVGTLSKEKMRKLVSCRSNSTRYKAKYSLSEPCICNAKGKETTERIILKEEFKAEHSGQQSQTGEGVSTGKKQIDVDMVQKGENKSIRTPIKRRRGADTEIVRALLLSPQSTLSRLRPRKEVPAFCMVNVEGTDNEFVVGRRIKVYWSGSRRWFAGRIVAFDKKNRLHKILYDDGDKEVLDLRKERFELEVMPTDHFKLQIDNSARKANGLDTANIREAVMKENSRNVSGAKTIAKSSESKQKNKAEKAGKSASSKAHRGDTEVIMEDLVSNADMIPNEVSELVPNKTGNMDKPGKANSHEDESNFVSKATKEFKAEATVVNSHSEFCSMASDKRSIKERADAVGDDSLKVSIAELTKKAKGLRKRLVPKAKRMRTTNRAVSREFGNVVETLKADRRPHIHCNEVMPTQMDVDISSEATDVGYQNLSRKNEAVENKASEGDGTSNGAPFTALDPTSKKKTAIGSGDVSINAANEMETLTKTETEDVITSSLLNPHNFKDERKVLDSKMEFATSIKKADDELMTGITNVQRPGDVDSMNTNHEAESILEAESMKPYEASCNPQPIVQISPEEAKPTVLQGKVKLENDESGKESKEGIDFISEKSEIYGSKEGPKQ